MPSSLSAAPTSAPAATFPPPVALRGPQADPASRPQTRTVPCAAEPLGERVEITVDGQHLAFDWGHPWQLGTAAFWAELTRRQPRSGGHQLGETLADELAACMLGGFGIPAAVGLAAFDAVRDAGLLDRPPSVAEIERVLTAPLMVAGAPRPMRYRFARQRARRLASALAQLDASRPPEDPVALRDWLMLLPGVGPKTASWVVRNHCACDEVAIIDIHMHRAGLAVGCFSPAWRLPRDYWRFEDAFLQLAALGRVSAADLDACVWHHMQALGAAQQLLLAR
ncbi:MAG TPA: hypothetical protein VK501_09350 [Baekduia sp.]|uniref:8-oxoguanine DNA glycosylase n=1 Tax=Baekduia sp. TaxID=2600305 RepID=UPI002C726BA9|nr:hypothetical protein [Baekduia sp.]HMJ34112.1 hypothetical protein [Baekduia sp.]